MGPLCWTGFRPRLTVDRVANLGVFANFSNVSKTIKINEFLIIKSGGLDCDNNSSITSRVLNLLMICGI